MDDKLINLGTNRYTFRPQLGVVHNRGKWSMELTGAVYIYTDNNDFFNGNRLEQDPYYTIQTHLVYTFFPGLWTAAGAGYGYGGKSTISGEKKNVSIILMLLSNSQGSENASSSYTLES